MYCPFTLTIAMIVLVRSATGFAYCPGFCGTSSAMNRANFRIKGVDQNGLGFDAGLLMISGGNCRTVTLWAVVVDCTNTFVGDGR